MTPQYPNSPETNLLHRKSADHSNEPEPVDPSHRPSILPKVIGISFSLAVLLGILLFFSARLWTHSILRDSLPQLDGSIAIPGLSAPVTVQRDAQGVPHIRAASLDDLILAQGYVTAQDRLWQMEALRRHASGTLAELLGSGMVLHDRTQRTLQLRAAADRAIAVLPPDQLHELDLYARGVNASIATQLNHLPLEFRLLHFTPAPWTPRDSLLVALVMYQDLTNSFPQKLNREALTARLPPAFLADLYPVGSWRDHPPTQTPIDLTAPQVNIPDIPLDESQTKLTLPPPPGAPLMAQSHRDMGGNTNHPASTQTLLALQQTMSQVGTPVPCEGCIAGSNNWVVSGAHTASGKPLLSNDMHLNFGLPGIWYETDLQSPTPSGTPFHVAGVALPGTPFIIVGHNDHIAWGFTNLGADVQDIYVEHTRGPANAGEFQSPDGTWHPILHHTEVIHVRAGRDVTLDVATTQHGNSPTPIISNLLTAGRTNPDRRTLALRWTIYDPANLNEPFFAVNSANDWPSLCAAFSTWGGPAQNVVYADDQGHIGYHAAGKIPLRGSVIAPSPLNPIPASGIDPASEWTNYIPFDQLPSVFDPPGGVLATANSRITPEGYPFPITLDWGAPYRNERIWKVLTDSQRLTPADMLRLQTDIYSDVDRVIAQRLAYAIDHAGPHTTANPTRLHQAADILRNWNGNVDANSPAPAIVDATRATLWPMILIPKLGPAWPLYNWGEKTYAEEQIILHTPDRWLPSRGVNWNDLLAGAVDKALLEDRAPTDLNKWAYGNTNALDIQHPIFAISPIIGSIIGIPTGTGPHPQSGDTTTVKQVSRTLGPSERFTADLSNLDHSTLNLVLGQSGNPISHWFMDQWPAWYNNTTFRLPFSASAVQSATTHTLTLTPQ
jgi:penicillin amidase